jgi:hypothetical protein
MPFSGRNKGGQLLELVGWAAAFMTFIAYSMKTMLPLRIAAIASNILFIAYGIMAGATPILALHIALLPFNCFRLGQIVRLLRKIRHATSDDRLPEGIESFLTRVEVEPNKILFRRGDLADRIYYLKSGRVMLEEIGKYLEPGEIFGEIAFFSKSRSRTLTARCVGRCEISAMREEDFTRLHYQNPAFAIYILRLLARRLEENAPRQWR